VRILLLAIRDIPPGVLDALASLGVHPVVVRSQLNDADLPRGDSVRVRVRGEPGRPMDRRWSRKELRVAVRDIHPDLLHITADPWTPTAQAGAAAARRLGIPYSLVGVSSIGRAPSLPGRWQSDRVRHGASALAGIVQPALDHLIRDFGASVPTAVLPPGGLAIPVDWAPRPVSMPLVFGISGRLVPERGVDLLLTALSQTGGPWRLRVLGTGPMQERLERQAQQLGLSARIHWLGAVPRQDLPRYLGEIDVLVVPSRSTERWVEASGSTAQQAMAAGVAVIVSRCGALPGVVEEAGMIVDEDDLPGLTRALQVMVEDPARSRSMGQLARQRMLNVYSDHPVAQRMVAFWRDALARG
jgi:glycosyltransferase involved in cell wall biosynthesis